jgi:hypothetical protein
MVPYAVDRGRRMMVFSGAASHCEGRGASIGWQETTSGIRRSTSRLVRFWQIVLQKSGRSISGAMFLLTRVEF